MAVGIHPWQTGWTETIEYFESKGYNKGELYATTWGDGNKAHASTRTHNFETLNYLRNFVEAVLAYTGAEKIDVITHSMGVTLGRKVIKGGVPKGSTSSLGAPLTDKVDTFLGLCGGNLGLTNCYAFADTFATCNAVNGYFPGTVDSSDMSEYMMDLFEDSTREGQHVYSLWSTADTLIGYGNIVWGKYTGEFPT